MVRSDSPVYSDDKKLIGQTSDDSVFHGIPHPNRRRTSNENRKLRQRSQRFKSKLILGGIVLLFGAVMSLRVAVAEMPLDWGGFSYLLSGGKISWIQT